MIQNQIEEKKIKEFLFDSLSTIKTFDVLFYIL